MTAPDPKQEEGIHISDTSGQVIIGNHNVQTQTITNQTANVTQADMEALDKMFTELRSQIAATAPAEKQEKACEKVDELEEAIKTEKPDLPTMEYVKNWFGKNLPQLAGAVTGVIVNPIVGKLVEVAGEALAQEFRRRFGVSS